MGAQPVLSEIEGSKGAFQISCFCDGFLVQDSGGKTTKRRRESKPNRLIANSYSATGNERTRILSWSKTTIAPVSKSPRSAGKFSSRSESCCSGRR